MGKLKLLRQLYKMEKNVEKNPKLKSKMEKWILKNYGKIKWNEMTLEDIHKTLSFYESIKNEPNILVE